MPDPGEEKKISELDVATTLEDTDEIVIARPGATYKNYSVCGAMIKNYAKPGDFKIIAQSTAPAGFLKCNGAPVSRTVYAALFAVIGTTFGNGDGSTTFNLPDLRGKFVRGWADDGDVDAGRVLGSPQNFAMQDHIHYAGFGVAPGGDRGETAALYGIDTSEATSKSTSLEGTSADFGAVAGVFQYKSSSPKETGSAGSPLVSTETRPTNLALLFCIKY